MERPDPPYTGDETTLLGAFLDFHRSTVAVKCAGLSDADARRAPLPPSPLMSPIGVVRHLTWVERYWFEYVLTGTDVTLPWTDGRPDADFAVASAETLASVLAGYAAQCARSRRLCAALAPDAIAARPRQDQPVSLRWILIHMVEETARHNGHLDAVRELIDGTRGE